MPLDRSHFLDIFKREVEDKLTALEQGLEIILQNAQDANFIDFLYRQVHTIKGAASMMQFPALVQVAKSLEDLFSSMRHDDLGVNPELTDILQDVLTIIRLSVENVSEQLDEGINAVIIQERIEKYLQSRKNYQARKKIQVCSLETPLINPDESTLKLWRTLVDRQDFEAPKNKAAKILIVEHSEMTRELVAAMFINLGYTVDTAGHVTDGLVKIAKEEYALVISDIEMPEISGFILCKKIKTDDELRQIPFIFLSSLEDDNAREQAVACGANALLSKADFDESTLFGVVKALISRDEQ